MGRATVIAVLLLAASIASGSVHRLEEQSLQLADGEQGISGYFKARICAGDLPIRS